MPHKHFNIRSLFAVILGWLFVCIYDLTYMILTFATLGLLSRRIFHYAAHGWGKTLLLLAGVELETEGLEHLNSDNGKIAIFNHQSLLDVLWLAALFPARGVAIVKKEFAYIPLVNLTFWSAGFVFIDRSNRQKALNALKSLATKIISERSTLFIAPEGTRSQSGEILPFKKGPFHIALDGNIPIVPLVVHGPHHLLPKKTLLIKPGKVYIKCLPPINTDSWSVKNLNSEIENVRHIMIGELKILESKFPNPVKP